MAYIEMKHSLMYQVGDTEIVANHDISLRLKRGTVIILGALSYKSTVLILRDDTNTEGDILIDGQEYCWTNSHQLTDCFAAMMWACSVLQFGAQPDGQGKC